MNKIEDVRSMIPCPSAPMQLLRVKELLERFAYECERVID